MTTVFGSASPCRRAARFGVSPTTAVLLRRASADEIADHDEPRGDADAHLQGDARGSVQLRRRLDERKPSLDRAFGVVFVGLRIAEIGEHAVAHIFGDETAEAAHRLGAHF